jgi:hypothetical protein
MIVLLFYILTFSVYAQVDRPAVIKGFDGKTFVKYPDKKKWVENDSVDTNYVVKKRTKVEYTNFDGETIDLTKRKPVFVPEKGKIVNSINVANDPAKDHYSLYFQLNEKAKVMIQIYTTDGERISDIVFQEFESGSNKVNIKKKFTKGSYVIYMTIDDEVFKHRVLFD